MEARKISDQFSSLSGNVKGYIRLKLELIKLTAVEKLALLTSHLMMSLVVFLLVMFFLFFLSFAFIYWYGDYVGPMFEGALIVVGFYLVASIVIYLFRYPLFINPLVSRLSTLILEEEEDEED